MRPASRNACLVLLAVVTCGTVSGQDSATQDQSLAQPIQRFDPAHQKPLVYSDKSLRATLVVGPERDSLRVLNRTTGREVQIDLPFEMAQVDEIRPGIGSKLIVRGMVNGSGSEVVLIDTRSDKLADKFLGYLPSLSPDGRHIVFIKFYPMHFSGSTEAHYMLYDLAKDSKGNRPTGGIAADDKNVGIPVYPPQIGNKAGDNVELTSSFVHNSASAGFFWKPDSTAFFFADRLEPENEITLVLADVARGGKITLKTARQPDEKFCSVFKDPQQKLSCNVIVRKAEFSANRLTVWYEIVNIQKIVTQEYSLSQFK